MYSIAFNVPNNDQPKMPWWLHCFALLATWVCGKRKMCILWKYLWYSQGFITVPGIMFDGNCASLGEKSLWHAIKAVYGSYIDPIDCGIWWVTYIGAIYVRTHLYVHWDMKLQPAVPLSIEHIIPSGLLVPGSHGHNWGHHAHCSLNARWSNFKGIIVRSRYM